MQLRRTTRSNALFPNSGQSFSFTSTFILALIVRVEYNEENGLIRVSVACLDGAVSSEFYDPRDDSFTHRQAIRTHRCLSPLIFYYVLFVRACECVCLFFVLLFVLVLF
jgi:hypothetical protein